MAIPTYEELMLPVLKLIADGKQTVAEYLPSLTQQYGLTDEEATRLLPSGKQTYLANRTHWARNYMSQAGLVVPVKRGAYVLTDDGRALLSETPSTITKETLLRFEKFRLWLEKSAAGATSKEVRTDVNLQDDATPEDRIEQAYRELDAALRDELLELLTEVTPVRFERLILDLLAAMGFGGGDLANTHMTRTSGDGGIDGIIHEDALGLDAVYIQAKRYHPDSKIGRPAIQQFVGSLSGEGATKGVFVTTSDFSGEARDYLRKVQHRIVLINGQELARLMIRHGVGIRARNTYVVCGIDEDYFDDLSAT